MIWISAIVPVVIIACALLPFVIRKSVNHALRKQTGFAGHVERVGVNLIAGKITLYHTAISKNDNFPHTKLAIRIPETSVLFQWKHLLRKTLVATVHVQSPEILIVATGHAPEPLAMSATPMVFSLKDTLEKFLPFRVDILVHTGKIRYGNLYSRPNINLAMENIEMSVADLSNIASQVSISEMEITAALYGGSARINCTLLPLEPLLTFDLKAELKAIDMVLLNDFLRAYGKIDVNSGTLDLYSEISVRGDAFSGYATPVLKNLDFVGIEDRNDNIFRRIWERVVAFSFQLLANRRNDQIATRIPLKGSLRDPKINTGAALAGVFKNAFIKAVTPSLDIISIGSRRKNTPGKKPGLFKRILRTSKRK